LAARFTRGISLNAPYGALSCSTKQVLSQLSYIPNLARLRSLEIQNSNTTKLFGSIGIYLDLGFLKFAMQI